MRIQRRVWLEAALVLGLVFLALAVRVYLLRSLPIGLHGDEAANGLDVMDILRGQRPIFFERNNGREPLFIYLQSTLVAVLGPTPYALRLTSAIVGALTIAVLYWMVREAFAGYGRAARWPALWTALFVTFAYWHINFSRIGLRAIMLPLMSCQTFGWFWRAWRCLDGSSQFPWVDLVLCGVCTGAALYTYTAARFLPVLIVVTAGAGIVLRPRTGDRRRFMMERVLPGVLMVGVVALVVFAPLGIGRVSH